MALMASTTSMFEQIRLGVAGIIDLDPAERGQCEDVNVFEGIFLIGAPAAIGGHLEGSVVGRGADS